MRRIWGKPKVRMDGDKCVISLKMFTPFDHPHFLSRYVLWKLLQNHRTDSNSRGTSSLLWCIHPNKHWLKTFPGSYFWCFCLYVPVCACLETCLSCSVSIEKGCEMECKMWSPAVTVTLKTPSSAGATDFITIFLSFSHSISLHSCHTFFSWCVELSSLLSVLRLYQL